jgi:hypothetical protein
MEVGVNKKRPFCQDVGCNHSYSPGMETVTIILTKDSAPGNTLQEIRGQLDQLLQFVYKAGFSTSFTSRKMSGKRPRMKQLS